LDTELASHVVDGLVGVLEPVDAAHHIEIHREPATNGVDIRRRAAGAEMSGLAVATPGTSCT
jgi:hypothetical protein